MIYKQKWMAKNLTKQDGEFAANVPGNLQYDYYIYKNWPDYQYGDNSKMFELIEDDVWEYYTYLKFSADKKESIWFHADGIDYNCEIYLNDKLLLRHEGSFSRIDIELTDYLLPENNKLSVTVLPHPKRKDAPVDRSQADEACKAPVCYGWAWHPRLLVSGIWQDAYIEVRGEDYIFNPTVTYKLSDDFKSAEVYFDWNCNGDVTASIYDKNNNRIWQGKERKAFIDNVELWWCAGQGEQILYTWVMESGSDKKSGKIGFKNGKLVMNEGAWSKPYGFPKSRSDAPATFVLNGRKIFLKGTNFITPDIFTGNVTKEKYRDQIMLAKKANMNVFRCWGGCGCQKEEFYELCDELGILVWVEFPLSCNLYPETEHYLKTLETEATEILLRLRKHACVALWCGGNELFNAWSGMTEQHLALRLLDTLCYKYDRERPFIMTSPLNGMAHGGYFFFDRETRLDNFALFKNAEYTCYTEFGPPALADKNIIDRIIPKSSQTFPVKCDDENWKAHFGTQNDPWRCQEDTRICFPECESLDEVLEYSDLMQSMTYKAIFEEARRQWPYCSMAINWCYNEPWYTVVNRHLIDFDSTPRPSYFAVKDSLRDVLASAGIPKFIWKAGEVFYADIVLHNDTTEEIERSIKVILNIDDEEYELLDWKGSCKPLSNQLAPTVRFKLPDIEGIRLFTLKTVMDDGTENEYTLRYLEKAKKTAVKMLNQND